MAAIDYAERVDELAGEVIGASRIASKRRQRVEYGHVPQIAAVICFEPPESDYVLSGNAVFARQRIEHVAVPNEQLPARRYSVRVDTTAEISSKRLDELSLTPVGANDALTRYDVGEYGIDRALGDAIAARTRLEARQALGKICLSQHDRRRREPGP
jgi:hypothetical protein